MHRIKINHPRLYAFFQSKVINSMMIVMILSLLITDYMRNSMLPLLCSAISFLAALGYTIWFCVKKPDKVVVNRWLSDIDGKYTLYFLIVLNIKEPSDWWFTFPAVCGVALLFISLVNIRMKYLISVRKSLLRGLPSSDIYGRGYRAKLRSLIAVPGNR